MARTNYCRSDPRRWSLCIVQRTLKDRWTSMVNYMNTMIPFLSFRIFSYSSPRGARTTICETHSRLFVFGWVCAPCLFFSLLEGTGRQLFFFGGSRLFAPGIFSSAETRIDWWSCRLSHRWQTRCHSPSRELIFWYRDPGDFRLSTTTTTNVTSSESSKVTRPSQIVFPSREEEIAYTQNLLQNCRT